MTKRKFSGKTTFLDCSKYSNVGTGTIFQSSRINDH